LTNDFILEAELVVDRYYLSYTSGSVLLTAPAIASRLPSANTVLTNASTVDPTAEPKLDLRWDFIQGADEYDLEWVHVFVDTPSVSGYVTAALDRIDFSKASRITTWENHYTLNLDFEQGILVYRVRALGKKAP